MGSLAVNLSEPVTIACQRTGRCCWQPTALPGKVYRVDGIEWERQPDGGIRCPKLSREDNVTCTVYRTAEYPLACRLYPIGLFNGHLRLHLGGPCEECLVGPARPLKVYLIEQGAYFSP